MLAIRLARMGSKKRPFFRLVVADSRSARDSRFVEILGHYNPRMQPALVRVDRDRFDYWVKAGAQPSDTVRTLLARHLSPEPPPAPRRGGKATPAPAAEAVPAQPSATGEPLRQGSGQALRQGSGQALRQGSGQALRQGSGQAES